MARHLLTVDDTFTIAGRGLVLTPPIQMLPGERLRPGDTLLLKHPDGSETVTTLGGLELSRPNPDGKVGLMLDRLTKVDVPIGTEVWSVG